MPFTGNAIEAQCDRCFHIGPPAYGLGEECTICYDALTTIILRKCGHTYCESCARRMGGSPIKCPVCWVESNTCVSGRTIGGCFDSVDPALRELFKRLYRQLCEEIEFYRFAPEEIYGACAEYYKFLRMLANVPDISPSRIVDDVWRCHLGDREHYDRCCELICGRVLQRYATSAAEYSERFVRTVDLYGDQCGPLPGKFWAPMYPVVWPTMIIFAESAESVSCLHFPSDTLVKSICAEGHEVVYRDRVLDPGAKVASVVHYGATVEIRPIVKKILIRMIEFGATSMNFKSEVADTLPIGVVYATLASRIGCPADSFHLMTGGEIRPPDNTKIADIVQGASNIILKVNTGRPMMTVRITSEVRPFVDIRVPADGDGFDAYIAYEQATGVSQRDLLLSFNGHALYPDDSLQSRGVTHEGAVVNMRLRDGGQ